MNRSASSKTLGYLLALFTVLVWGTTFISTKTLLTVFTPLQVMLTRFVLGQLFLWLLRPRRLHLAAKEEIWFFLMGLFSCSLYFLAENFALLHTQASNVSILITTAPIFTAVLAHFTTEEKLRSGTLLGFLVAFCGVVLVVFNGAFVLKLSPLGDFLSIVAALMWAIYSVIAKGFAGKYDSLLLTRRILFWGMVTALPFALLEHEPYPLAALTEPVILLNCLFLGLLGSALCYVFWNEAFRRLGVVVTNSFIYTTPFITIVAAAIFLDEPIYPAAVAGAVLITAGVVAAGRTPLKASKT